MENIIFTTFNSDELRKMIRDSLSEILNEYKLESTGSGSSEIMTVSEVSEFLKLSVQTIYGYTSKRLIPFAKRSKRLYFNKQELLVWIQEGRCKTRWEIEQEADEYLQRKNTKRRENSFR